MVSLIDSKPRDKIMTTETAKYRFDSALGEVREYDKEQRSYLFLGTYHKFGITSSMRENTKIAKVEHEKEREELLRNA